MKYRQGFVSNSSSSSFVVAFPRVPTSAEDVKEMLYSNRKTLADPYSRGTWDTAQLAQSVFKDLIKPATDKEILDSVVQGYFEGQYDSWDDVKNLDFGSEEYQIASEKARTINNELASKLIDKLKDEAGKDSIFYVLSYSDNDGSFGIMMEHGDIFRSLPHIRVSYH